LAQRRGRQAEDLARAHLERAGLRVVEGNLRLGGGELDLVAWDQATLVFVEVKGRGSHRGGWPEEAVDGPKRRRLAGAAQAYLARLERQPEPPCRFDVVAVDFGAGAPQVRHLRDAFRLGD
jgi:putative endonuclease